VNVVCSGCSKLFQRPVMSGSDVVSGVLQAFALREFVLIFLPAIMFLTGCREESHSLKPAPPETLADSSPVYWPTDDRRERVFCGSESCRSCHQEICDRYAAHPMSNATRPVSETSSAAFTREATFQRGGREYEVMESTGVESVTVLVHCERVLTSSGGIVYEQKAEIDFGIGSGKRGFSFVTNRDGLLFQSPLTWYSGGRRWDLSPGYNPVSHPGFERRISDGCVTCHVGRANAVAGSAHRFASPAFLECGIGCERCHGPGKSHIDFHVAGATNGADPIVNPVDLESSARESVCYQCHLHGARRILRSGRTEYDFRPGDKVSDIWIVMTNGTGVDGNGQTSAVSQVEQIVSSQCFVQSQGRFGCVSCHDPHGMPEASQAAAYFRSRCLECHSAAGHECGLDKASRQREQLDDSCVACHMPRLNANDVPHTSQTDHRILRRPGEASSRAEVSANGMRPFQPQDFPVPDTELERAMGLMMAEAGWAGGGGRQLVASSGRLLAPMISERTSDVRLLDAQAGNLLQAGQFDAGLRLSRQAERFAPDDEAIIELQTIALTASGDHEGALEKAEAYLKLNPWNSQMLARHVALLMGAGRRDDAIQAAIDALTWNPWLHSTRQQLIDLATEKGDAELVKQQSGILEELRRISTLYSTKNP
jgi:predicted CXXCH cytochrome family protein